MTTTDDSADAAPDRTAHLVRPSEAARAAGVLARGFGDDPLMTWLFDGTDDMAVTLLDFFDIAVACGLHRGFVYRTNGWEAVAVWSPLGDPTMFDEQHGEQVGELMVAALGMERTVGRSELSALTAEHHHPGEHLYLPFVAVDPPSRSQGWGSVVLQPMLDQAARDGLDVYLESSNPRNLGFYERLGFRTTASWAATGGPSLTGMLRVGDADGRTN